MRINLPPWPPSRLVAEAVYAYNLRHLYQQLDVDDSPWPEIYNAVLRFLRHQQSPFDRLLCERAGHDEEYRDELAAEVARIAYRQYSWLRREIDPRPLPSESGPSLVFDRMAARQSDLYSQADQVLMAIRDLRRSPGDHEKELQALNEALKLIRKLIDAGAGLQLLSSPVLKDGEPRFATLIGRHPDGRKGDYFFGGRQYCENHLTYAGFRCPECQSPVKRTKRPVPHGQGRRMIGFSCGCLSVGFDPPGPNYRLGPITMEHWQEFLQRMQSNDQ